MTLHGNVTRVEHVAKSVGHLMIGYSSGKTCHSNALRLGGIRDLDIVGT